MRKRERERYEDGRERRPNEQRRWMESISGVSRRVRLRSLNMERN